MDDSFFCLLVSEVHKNHNTQRGCHTTNHCLLLAYIVTELHRSPLILKVRGQNCTACNPVVFKSILLLVHDVRDVSPPVKERSFSLSDKSQNTKLGDTWFSLDSDEKYLQKISKIN